MKNYSVIHYNIYLINYINMITTRQRFSEITPDHSLHYLTETKYRECKALWYEIDSSMHKNFAKLLKEEDYTKNKFIKLALGLPMTISKQVWDSVTLKNKYWTFTCFLKDIYWGYTDSITYIDENALFIYKRYQEIGKCTSEIDNNFDEEDNF